MGNTYAMKIAEIRKGTPDPPAGTIVHKDDGEPNGVVLESAQQLITRHVPPFTREQQKAGLVKMIQDFNAEGMTGAKDPGISELKWTLYNELLKEGTARRPHLRAVGRAAPARSGRRRAGARQRQPASAAVARRRACSSRAA